MDLKLKCNECHEYLNEVLVQTHSGDVTILVEPCSCKLDDLKNDIKHLTSENDEYEDYIEELNDQVSDLESQIEKLEKEIERLEDIIQPKLT